MPDYPLVVDNGHLFVEIEGRRFIVDTGSPASFGCDRVRVDGREHALASSFMGLTTEQLSTLVERPADGLIGTDILNLHDVIIDVPAARVTISSDELACHGESLPLRLCMEVPVLAVKVDGVATKMFFDTGAPTSYYQDEALLGFPPLGPVDDFYPGFGPFQSETYRAPVQIGSRLYHLRCGQLPTLLGMTLMLANTEGIVGNEMLLDRAVGYFPRRREMVMG